MQKLVLIFLFLLPLTGCVRHSQIDDGEICSRVAAQIDAQVQWGADEEVEEWVSCLLKRELTPEAAIQIALLNNPKVQVLFEEVGIAHADLVEAGLFSNPNFSLEMRYPPHKGLVTNIEYLVTTSFLDIFLIPLRTRLAEAELEQAKRKVTHAILELAFEVRQVYYELIATQQKLKYTQLLSELSSIQKEIADRQKSVGNVNLLDLQQFQGRFLAIEVEVAKEQTTLIRLRQSFNHLLGLTEEVCLVLPDISEEIDYAGYALCALEATALHERQDLQEIRFEILRFERMLGLKEGWTYTQLQAGVAGERDPDGVNLVGFGVAGNVPIFNYGQAARQRIFAQLRQALARYRSLEIQVLTEVREAHQLLMNESVVLKSYRAKILPMQEAITHSTEGLYAVMGLGVDRLLETKREQLDVYRHYLDSLKEYWVARVQLDKALGGNLFLLIPCGGAE